MYLGRVLYQKIPQDETVAQGRRIKPEVPDC